MLGFRIGVVEGVVRAENVEVATVTRAAGVGSDDTVEGLVATTPAGEADAHDHGVCGKCGFRRGGV